MTPDQMDQEARAKRLPSLDRLIQDQIANPNESNYHSDELHELHDSDDAEMKTTFSINHNDNNNTNTDADANNNYNSNSNANSNTKSYNKSRDDYSLETYKLIALINGGSGAKKGWILAQELRKFGASVYNLKDLCVSETVRTEMGLELQRNNGRSIMLICGGGMCLFGGFIVTVYGDNIHSVSVHRNAIKF